MGKSTFHGGVNPYEGKELSKDKPMKEIVPHGEMVYPMSQHIGAPAVPIVKKGDKVLVGQKIMVDFVWNAVSQKQKAGCVHAVILIRENFVASVVNLNL